MRYIVGVFTLVAFGLIGGAALAHGDKNKVVGMVEVADANHVEIKTADGHVVSVLLDKSTKIYRGKNLIEATQIMKRDRAVVHLMQHQGPPMASEIRLGAAPDKHVEREKP